MDETGDDDLARRLALSFLEHEHMNEAADYVNRGRVHEGRPTHQLEDQWVQAFRSWIAGAGTQSMDDLAAELRLRGLDVPSHRVVPELEVLQRRIRDAGPPSEWESGPLSDKVDAFLKAREKPSG